MTQRDNILQELKDLESTLANYSSSSTYNVPAGYFEDLAGQVMARIRALETQNTNDELLALSSLAGIIGKQTPYRVPAGYFDGLEKELMRNVLQHEKEQSPQEELESLSPFLSGLKKQTPYSIPVNYFDELGHTAVEQKPVSPAKVISIATRKWFRYAAAAVVICAVVLGGLLLTDREKIDPSDKSYAWIKKNMQKVSTDELNNFIDMSTEKGAVLASNSSKNEVKELVKNIPDEELSDFLNDVELAEPDPDDLILN